MSCRHSGLATASPQTAALTSRLTLNPLKFPTVLRLDPNSGDLEFIRPLATAAPGEIKLKYFKVSLMERAEWFEGIADPNVLSLVENTLGRCKVPHSTSTVVSIFLRGMWDMAVGKILSSCDNVHLHAVITWPACWKEETLGRLKQAVEEAGITAQASEVLYRTEHEAAVRAILFDHAGSLSGLFKVSA